MAVLAAASTACDGRAGGGRRVTALGEPVASVDGAEELTSLDWREATYLSTCGLPRVTVQAGVGESSSRTGSAGAPVWGIEVVDVVTGDLDDDGTPEAAVLMDCLGADSYRPHVVLVRPDGVGREYSGAVTVTPSAGGTLPAGRPQSIRVAADGALDVAVVRGGRREVHRLGVTPAVIAGAELPATPGAVLEGMLSAVDGTVITVSVTPDDGYRLTAPADLPVDPGGGGPSVPAAQLVGRGVRVELGADGSVVRAAAT